MNQYQDTRQRPKTSFRRPIDAWINRSQWGEAKREKNVLEFLPTALEVLERPPSPAGRWLGGTIITLLCIAIVWAIVGEVDIVAIAEGKIISSGRTKDIQPMEKGVVKAIHVTEGDAVTAGQILIELDDTQTHADQIKLEQELRFVRLNGLREQALLKALQNKEAVPQLDLQGVIQLTDTEIQRQSQLLHQTWLDHQSRVNTLLSQKRERQATLQTNAARIIQLKQTLPLVTRRSEAMKKLMNKDLLPEMEYLTVAQERIEQQQTLATYKTQNAQYQAAIETTMQQLNTLRAEAIHKTLSQSDEYQRQIQSLIQELNKVKDINAKQLLIAPENGTVQQLAIHTIGGVVTEAQVLMKLVPENDFLEVEAVLENKDIGFVFEGQKAEVKINTFNFTRYGIIDAEVIDLTADAIVDEVKGLVYKLRLKLEQSEMQVDDRVVGLLPGMAVMAEIKTGKRRLIEYVMSPLLRKMNESIRER